MYVVCTKVSYSILKNSARELPFAHCVHSISFLNFNIVITSALFHCNSKARHPSALKTHRKIIVFINTVSYKGRYTYTYT